MMLCRVADSLFWMSRYIERAENTARLVDVNLQLLLESSDAGKLEPEEHWLPILTSTGESNLYYKLFDTIDSESIMNFLTFHEGNPSSVFSCIMAGRENARMIRDQITEEMWEAMNRLYHYLKKSSNKYHVGQSALFEQFNTIKEYSHLFTGITESTFNHSVGYEFMKAGRFIERADKTGRIIGSKLHTLEDPNQTNWISHWGAVLRACSASTAYKQTYKMDVNSRKVLEMLIFSRDFPRSMFYSLLELQKAVHAVSGCPITHYSNEAERLCGRLISQFSYASIDEIMNQGIDNFLEQSYASMENLTLELSNQYMFFPVIDPATE